MGLLVFIQEASEIEEKIQKAPNSAYEIGVVIGTYLPFVVMVLIAYAFYYYSKKRRSKS
ncbi:hypothetical protein PXD56_01295 [Maribacter sp. SA7]|uniref:hypothetical protein n=1 Tax=Maribacter zhoushanensis TaxID=3030012 RepID=UPI0023EB2ABD|nr:hypothetical protein [Maribacter zhoushanensis]MDF4201569.1 hypothetical protein [Maribacter zhoushanensis]